MASHEDVRGVLYLARERRDRAEEFLDSGNLTRAFSLLEEAVNLLRSLSPSPLQNPDAALVLFSSLVGRGSCSLQLGRPEAAVNDITAALSAKPEGSARAYMVRGEAYVALHERQKAFIDLCLAKELDPALADETARLLDVADADAKARQARIAAIRRAPPVIDLAYYDALEPHSALRRSASPSRETEPAGRRRFLDCGNGMSAGVVAIPSAPHYSVELLRKKECAEAYEDADAMLELGRHFENGTGGSQQPHLPEAFSWYLRAYECTRDPRAACAAGWCLRNGVGTQRDAERAAALFHDAATRHHYPKAHACLGYLLDHGEGVPRDPAGALRHYTTAAEAGDVTAQLNLGLLLQRRCGSVNGNVPGSKEGDAAAQAFFWFRRAAEQGNIAACVHVGVALESGVGVDAPDPVAAARWYAKAAESGDATAQAILGCCYEKGVGVNRNPDLAKVWYVRSAEQGNLHAVHGLKRLFGVFPVS